jgi:hypothetical protein
MRWIISGALQENVSCRRLFCGRIIIIIMIKAAVLLGADS